MTMAFLIFSLACLWFAGFICGFLFSNFYESKK